MHIGPIYTNNFRHILLGTLISRDIKLNISDLFCALTSESSSLMFPADEALSRLVAPVNQDRAYVSINHLEPSVLATLGFSRLFTMPREIYIY